jgi:hypothetical protein
MSEVVQAIEQLAKAMEAGVGDAAPSTLTQGPAMQVEDLSPTMHNACYEDEHIKLQKIVGVTSCKATLAQFMRKISYGQLGRSAQIEGGIGRENTSQVLRFAVPMTFYSQTRRNTMASTMVETATGEKMDEMSAKDAALLLAGDIEWDCFRGMDDMSNGGVFDGNPLSTPAMPNMHGLSLQVRQSDTMINSRDAMFAEFGSDETVVLTMGATLSQEKVEDAAVRSALNFGKADQLIVDPIALSAYNKLAIGKERIILAGSPQEATGSTLRKQWVSGGTVSVESTNWLRGKYKPASPVDGGPIAPTGTVAVATSTTGFKNNDVFIYFVTTGNEVGESTASPAITATITADGQKATVTITHPSGISRFFNVYRTLAGAGASTAKFVGRVTKTEGSTTTDFVDLGNRLPASVTGFLIQSDTMKLRELCSYSRIKLAQTDLSVPEGHFRFVCLTVPEPRKNVLIDSIKGTF